MAFLESHAQALVAIDFFAVPTLTFGVLYVFVVLAHERRRVLHFNVTDSPSATWTAQQVVEAFPFEPAARYLQRDRDSIYGASFARRVEGLGMTQKRIAPQAPWQSPYVERLIGTLRRECLDHVILINERHLRHVLRDFIGYYHRCRPHRSLEHDAPDTRPVQATDQGQVVELPMAGGLHHQYTRRAA